MASLVLGTIGAGIGASIGGTFLGMSAASVGFMAGSTLGDWLFPPDGMHTQGARLSDLTVQSASRGAPIPKVYGTSRIAGNVIWTNGLTETAHTQSSGGGKGGGGGSSHTTYTYSASFAVGLCEGPITGIRRIWADSVLIYNKGDSATTDELAISNQVGITIYTGSEEQEPDPLMEGIEGPDNIPAYRGLAYIVFDTLQLEKYGNRIPNITCEVVEDGSLVDLPWIINEVSTNAYGYTGFAAGNNLFVATRANSNSLYREAIVSSDGENWTKSPIHATLNLGKVTAFGGGLFVTAGLGGFAWSTDGLNWTEANSYSAQNISCLTYGDNKFVGLASGTRYVYSEDGDNWSTGNFGWFTSNANAIAYGNGVFVGVGNYRYSLTSPNGTSWTENPNALPAASGDQWRSIAFGNNKFIAVNYSGSDIAYSTDGVNWTAQAFTGGLGSISFENGVFYITSGSASNIVYYSTDGLTWDTKDIGSPGYSIWHAPLFENSLLVTVVKSYYIGQPIRSAALLDTKLVGLNPYNLSSIISDLCNKAGATSIDVSNISSTIKGFTRTKPMTAKNALTPLLDAYQLTVVESDYQLKFIPKDGSVDETVSSEELNAVMDAADSTKNNDPLKITKKDETTLPRRIVTEYIAGDSDYLVGVQQAQRIYNNG